MLKLLTAPILAYPDPQSPMEAVVKVQTDHGALRWLRNFKDPQGQVASWLEVLGTFDFEVQHQPGLITAMLCPAGPASSVAGMKPWRKMNPKHAW